MHPDHSWLDGRVTVSEPIGRALQIAGGHGRLEEICDALASDLGLEVDRLGAAGYRVLADLLTALDEAGSIAGWLSGDRAHRTLADQAIAGRYLDEVVEAAVQFGFGKASVGPVTVADVEATIRDALATQLAKRLLSAIDEWEKRGAWAPAPPADLRQRREDRRRERQGWRAG